MTTTGYGQTAEDFARDLPGRTIPASTVYVSQDPRGDAAIAILRALCREPHKVSTHLRAAVRLLYPRDYAVLSKSAGWMADQ
jgi:hypothetical protein